MASRDSARYPDEDEEEEVFFSGSIDKLLRGIDTLQRRAAAIDAKQEQQGRMLTGFRRDQMSFQADTKTMIKEIGSPAAPGTVVKSSNKKVKLMQSGEFLTFGSFKYLELSNDGLSPVCPLPLTLTPQPAAGNPSGRHSSVPSSSTRSS